MVVRLKRYRCVLYVQVWYIATVLYGALAHAFCRKWRPEMVVDMAVGCQLLLQMIDKNSDCSVCVVSAPVQLHRSG